MGRVWRCEGCGESPGELVSRNGRRLCAGCNADAKVKDAMRVESYVTGLMVDADDIKKAVKA